MIYEEFRKNILKANQKKYHYKVYNSYGTRDIYRWCITNKMINKNISEKEFREIINTINNSLQDQLMQGKDIRLPERLGIIEIRKINTKVSLEEGKIKTNRAVDWGNTLKLWYEDEEAFNNKTLIRTDNKERFKIYYNKSHAVYNNKMFFSFTPTRSLKQRLKDLIINQGFDALLMYR